MESPSTTYLFMLLISVFGVLLSLVLYQYFKLLQKIRSKEEKSENEAKQTQSKAEDIIKQARNESDRIIREAHQKSQQMLADTNKFVSGEAQETNELFKQTANKYLNEYTNQLSQIESEALKEFKTVSEQLSQNMLKVTDESLNIVKQEVTASAKYTQQAFDKLQLEAKKEVEEYKKQRLAEFEKELVGVSQKLAQEILAKEINPKEHEKLVSESVEQFKKDVLANS